jgi:uncharacterized protein (DUF1778 family)
MKTGTEPTQATGRWVHSTDFDAQSKRKTVTKNLRVDASMSALIEQAAASTGMTFTSFVLEAAAARAERHLLDKCFITVDAQSFADIETLLAQDHEPTEKLKALFKTNAGSGLGA